MPVPEGFILPKVEIEPIRKRITKLTSRIIFKLEDRASFPLNSPIYQTGTMSLSDGSNLSFFEHATKGLEEYHGILGRWKYPGEYPLMIAVIKPVSIIDREVTCGEAKDFPLLPPVNINIKDKLLPFYTGTLLPRLCDPTDDPNTYGETAYIDADVVELFNERINLGRYVVLSKVDPRNKGGDEKLWDLVDKPAELDEALRDREREKDVVYGALAIAARLGLNMRLTDDLTRWIIDTTTDLEVKYLQGLANANLTK